jgi:hypothetical protein
MFTTSHSLQLSGLTLTSKAPVAGSVVAGDQATVALDTVVVQGSESAFLVRAFRAKASRFSNNGDTTATATGGAVVNAETVELHDSEFVGNGNHPIAGGAWPAPDRIPLARRVTLDNTTFTGNTATLLLIDAKVSIRASRFIQNGRLPANARDAWGCCGGALTLVRAEVEIFDSDFKANGSSGFGGAIHAIASRLTVGRSTFEGNEARVGGAIMSWGRPPRVNIWSADDWTDLPRLVLSRVTFQSNKASAFGGALVFAGAVQGDGLVFKANQAALAGGALASWRAAALPAPFDGVLQALVDNTESQPADRIALARSALTGNDTGGSGATVSFADAEAAVGNVIVARNTSGSGAAVSGTKLRIVNSVIAENRSIGLQAPAGATVSLGNSAIFRNATNCALGTPPIILGPNMQDPGTDCGSQIQTANPGLDGSFAPGLFSAARDAGDIGLCVAEPTVAGVDLYGKTRIGTKQACAIGAVERDRPETIAAGLTFGAMPELGDCLIWLLFFLLLLVFILAYLMRRRKKRSPHANAPHANAPHASASP